jgi:hypothetical protein
MYEKFERLIRSRESKKDREKKDKQWSTKRYIDNQRLSKRNPTENRGVNSFDLEG